MRRRHAHGHIHKRTHTNKSTAWHEHDAIERQLRLSSPKRCLATGTNRNIKRAHGVVVSHPLRMRKALGSIPSGSICQDLILLPCVFAYTRGLCHNTEHQRQTLKGANVFLEKTTLPWLWCSHREGLNIQSKSLRSRTLSLKPQLSPRRTSFDT